MGVGRGLTSEDCADQIRKIHSGLPGTASISYNFLLKKVLCLIFLPLKDVFNHFISFQMASPSLGSPVFAASVWDFQAHGQGLLGRQQAPTPHYAKVGKMLSKGIQEWWSASAIIILVLALPEGVDMCRCARSIRYSPRCPLQADAILTLQERKWTPGREAPDQLAG